MQVRLTSWYRFNALLVAAMLGLALSRTGQAEDHLQGTMVIEYDLATAKVMKAYFRDKSMKTIDVANFIQCTLCPENLTPAQCLAEKDVCKGLVLATARAWGTELPFIYTQGSPACITMSFGGTLKTWPPNCK